MSLADETQWMDATDQARLVADGEVTPLELLDAAIERIERLDPPLNAVNIRWFDQAREIATDLRGLVQGVQIEAPRGNFDAVLSILDVLR